MPGRRGSVRSAREAVRAWIVTARPSNLPTVWSNVLAGALLGGGDAIFTGLPVMLLAGTMFYTGGMVLNDLADRRIDLLRGTPRPLAQGLIGVRSAGIVAALLLAGGAALPVLADVRSWLLSAVLLVAIIAYDLLNKRVSASILLMGVCRGVLVMLAAQTCGGDPLAVAVLALAAAVTIATVLITIVARDEHLQRPTPRARAGVVIGFVPVLLFVPLGAGEADPGSSLMTPGLVIALIWALCAALLGLRSAAHLLRPPIAPRRAVMGWLAGLPCIDAVALALGGSLMLWWMSGIPIVLSIATMAAHRRISGT